MLKRRRRDDSTTAAVAAENQPFPFRRAIRDVKEAIIRQSGNKRTRASSDQELLAGLRKELLYEVEMTILGRKLGYGERTLSHLSRALAIGIWKSARGFIAKTINHPVKFSRPAYGTNELQPPQPLVKDVLHPLVRGVFRAQNLAGAVEVVENLLWKDAGVLDDGDPGK